MKTMLDVVMREPDRDKAEAILEACPADAVERIAELLACLQDMLVLARDHGLDQRITFLRSQEAIRKAKGGEA
jgi:hypothetical protein